MCAKIIDSEELHAAFHEVTKEKLIPGALVEAELYVEDGLRLKGRQSKPKKIVIIGYDKERDEYYGTILINTKLNPNAGFSEAFLNAQYPLLSVNYPGFLRYNSYLDCAVIFPISFNRLASGQYFGRLTDDDFDRVIDILETTPTISTKEKKRFGIKRKRATVGG